MSSKPSGFAITFLFYCDGIEDPRIVGHCLEMDIVGVGNTPEEAGEELAKLVYGHIQLCLEKNRLDNLFNSAPDKYWKMLGSAIEIELPLKIKDILASEKVVEKIDFRSRIPA